MAVATWQAFAMTHVYHLRAPSRQSVCASAHTARLATAVSILRTAPRERNKLEFIGLWVKVASLVLI